MYERTYELELMSDLFNLFVRKISSSVSFVVAGAKDSQYVSKTHYGKLRRSTVTLGTILSTARVESLFPMFEIECQVQIVYAFIWYKIS